MAVTPAQVRPGPTKKPTHSRHSSEVGYSEEPNGGTGAAEAGSLPASIDTKHATAAHRFNHNNSILAVAVAQDTLYAGTQGGEILVYNLQTYERLRAVTAHGGSVLGLCLTQAGSLLLSSAGDRHVNVWEPSNLTLLASLYSEYDTGDIFCVSWSARLQTVYFGAQNTSIQWYSFKDYNPRVTADPASHPSVRPDRFFDSPGPGGTRTPRRESSAAQLDAARINCSFKVSNQNIHQFAHYGYVYCMLLAPGGVEAGQREETLITGGGDGVIKLWSLDGDDGGRPREVGILDDGKESGEPVLSIVLDGTILYGGRVDGWINVWDLETKQILRNIDTRIREDVLTLSVGRGLLFAALVNGTVLSFDQRHECIDKWKGHSGRVLASCFAEGSGQPWYITGGNDDTIALWKGENAKSVVPDSAQTSQTELVSALRDFVAFRSVSSDPGCKVDCRKAAHYLRELLKSFGGSTEMFTNENPDSHDDQYNPVVYAHFKGSGDSSRSRKRIVFYGHYDVINAENKTGQWKSDPFLLEGRDGYLVGRGASDNKGPIIAAIFAVAELVSKKKLASDVIFLIEGEEEMGSRGFQRTIRRHKSFIGKVDWILLANSYWVDDEVPCLTYGLRGVLRATVKIESDEPDLHSGVDGSELIDEPMKDLVMLIAKLSGPHGKVLIPRFYDNVLSVTKDERALYREVSQVLLERNPALGTPDQVTASLMGRWREATLTIHGIRISGPTNSTIIPRQAEAILSMRLVPNQEVADIRKSFEDFLYDSFDQIHSTNHLTINIDHTAEPWLGDRTNKLFKTLEQAVMEVWDDPTADDSAPNPHSSATSPTIRSNSTTKQRTPQNNKTQPASQPAKLRRKSSSAATKPPAPTSSTLTAAPLSPTAVTTTASSFPFPSAAASGSTAPDSSSSTSQPPRSRRKPLYIREGGSIPAIRFLEKEFGAQAAHLPCGQASDNAHLDNERFRVLNLYKAMNVFGKVFGGMD